MLKLFGNEAPLRCTKWRSMFLASSASFLFRGPGCRKEMLEWWRDHLWRVETGEDIRSIRVWGTVGNKTDIIFEWPPAKTSRSGRRRSPAG